MTVEVNMPQGKPLVTCQKVNVLQTGTLSPDANMLQINYDFKFQKQQTKSENSIGRGKFVDGNSWINN